MTGEIADKPKVFIVQDDGTKDLSSVFSISDQIEVACNRGYPIFGDPTTHLNTIARKMAEFKSTDYLLMIGDPINIGLCTHYAFLNCDSINVLRWNRDNRRYHKSVVYKQPPTIQED